MKCIPLAFLVGGLACASLAAAADPSDDHPRFDPPLVVDADGKVVGRYTYTAGPQILPVALFDDEGTLTELTLGNIWGNAFLTFTNTSGLFHTTPDCTGTTYIGAPSVGVRPGAVVWLANDRFLFFLADSNRAVKSVRVLSVGDTVHCEPTNEVLSNLYVTSSPALDLTARFRLPLHVR